MAAKYPNDIDTYTIKQNITPGLETSTGDYVMAEHVNDLQEAIVSIEQALGTNPQGNSIDVSSRFDEVVRNKPLKIPSFCIFYGDPLTFNGSTTMAQTANEFLFYDYVVFASGLEDPAHPNYQLFVDLINQLKASRNIKIYGAIDVGVSTSNLTLEAIEIRIVRWDTIGADGIFLDNFGYDNGVSRERQNSVIDIIHARELSAFIRATNDQDVFESTYDSTYNPGNANPKVSAVDIYLHNNFVVDTTQIDPYSGATSSINKSARLIGYRKAVGTKIFGSAVVSSSLSQTGSQDYYDFAQAVALLYSYDGFYATTENFGLDSNSQKLYNNLSLVGNYYDNSPQVITSGNTYYRIGNFGKITVDTVNHMYVFEGLAVPGDSITGSVDVGTIINVVVDAINSNPEGIIAPEKIAPLLASHIEDIVIQAINNQINKGLVISSAMIEDLNANKITTGDLHTDRMKANVVQAINAYVSLLSAEEINAGIINADALRANVISAINANIGNVTIDGARVGDLTAEHIKSGDIDVERLKTNVIIAINTHVSNLTSEQIDAGIISADAMRANVISAINANIGSITIDFAKIGNVVINTAHIADASITTAKITNASITNAKLANLSVGTAQIQDAAITNAKIGTAQIQTVHIQDAAITNTKIGNLAVSTANIMEGSITNALIASAAVDTANIRIGAITTAIIGDLQVTTEKVANSAITNAKIGIAAIGEANIQNAAISTAKIMDAAITNAKILDLDAGKIVSGTISTDILSANVIEAINLRVAGAVISQAKIEDLSASKITSGTIDATKVTISTGGSSVPRLDFTGDGIYWIDAANNVLLRMTKSQGIVVHTSSGIKIDSGGSIRVGPTEEIVIDSTGIKARAGASDYTNFFDAIGIRTIDSVDNNKQLIMSAGELKLTKDGGQSFSTAITADGIYGAILTDGSLPADKFDKIPPDIPTWRGDGVSTSVEQTASTARVLLTITWNQVDDADLEGYRVWIDEGGNNNYRQIATIGRINEYTYTGAKPNVTYAVKISSYDSQGNECSLADHPDPNRTTCAKVIITQGDTLAPGQPGAPIITHGIKMFGVKWNAVTTNVDGTPCYDISYYVVQKATSANSFNDWTSVCNVDGTMFVDKDVEYVIDYKYRVIAVDTTGNQSLASPSTLAGKPSQVGAADIVARSITSDHIAVVGLDARVITSGRISGEFIEADTITADKFESTLYGDIVQALRYVQGQLKELSYSWVSSLDQWNTGTFVNTINSDGVLMLDPIHHWDSGEEWDDPNLDWDIPITTNGTWESPVIDVGAVATMFNTYKVVASIPSDGKVEVYAKHSEDNVIWSDYELLNLKIVTCRYSQFKIVLNVTSELSSISINEFRFEFYDSESSHDHNELYDKYSSWTYAVNDIPYDAITSNDVLNFKAGPNVTISRTADDEITFSADGGVHDLVGSAHSVSGLTSGHVLRATGATTFAFGAIQSSDLPTIPVNKGGTNLTTIAAGNILYASGANTFAPTAITSFGRSLIDDADALTARTTLALGNSATLNTGTAAGTVATGDHTHSQLHNQSHVLNGADHTVSGLTTGHFLKATSATSFGFAAHGLTASSVGAVAVNSAITGATKCKITYDTKGLVTAGADLTASDLPTVTVAKGGTNLTTIASGNILYTSALDTLTATPITAFGRSLIDDADNVAARTTLGLGNSAILNTGTTAGTVATGDHTHGQWITSGSDIYYDGGNVRINALIVDRVLVSDINKNVVSSSVTSTELGYLSGVTSSIQTQLDGKASNTHDHDIRYLSTTNTTVYIPTADYHPATKLYVDSNSGAWVKSGNDIYYNTGNVGIGETTPLTALHVKKPSLETDALGASLASVMICNSSAAALNEKAEIQFATSNTNLVGSAISALYTDWAESGIGQDLVFSTKQAAGVLTERMRITNTGNVGIGSTTPGTKLEVVADNTAAIFKSLATSGVDTGILIQGVRNGQTFGGTHSAWVSFGNYDNNDPNPLTATSTLARIGAGQHDADGGTGYFYIETNDGTALQRKFSITKTGEVQLKESLSLMASDSATQKYSIQFNETEDSLDFVYTP